MHIRVKLFNLSSTKTLQNTYNWMAWCKRDVSDFFRWNFFSFKSAWIFACAFQLSSTTFPCTFFAWFALCFWEKQRQNIVACTMNTTKQNWAFQSEKWYRRMLYYLIEKHMQKFRHFWRKKNFTWKSHLRPSCTKPFNQDLKAFEARPKGALRPDLKGLKAAGKNVP